MSTELERSLKVLETRGRHSKVYLTEKYAIKVFDEKYRYNFEKEVKFLTYLQVFNFVPKLFYIDPFDLKIVMERLYGKPIYVAFSRDVAKRCLKICFVLDTLGIQKEEMARPHKHIIIQNGRVVFIDFERGVFTKRPSNVTQFCAYLRKFGIFIPRHVIKNYKNEITTETFKEIIKYI